MSAMDRRRFGAAAAGAAALMSGRMAPAAEALVVGAYPANPPWEYKNEQGQFEGFEVDLVRAIGQKLGAAPEFQDMGFQALFAATSSNRIDLAISSITITGERLKNQSFTQGYFDSDLALAAQAGTPLRQLADVKGRTLGALATSTGEIWIKENTERYGIGGLKSYNNYQDMLLDTQNGRVDGAVSDLAGMQFVFKKMPGMTIVERIRTGDRYGIMMRKGSPLLDKVNGAITLLKQDGTLGKLHEKWLGAAAEPGSSTLTVQPVPTAG